MLHDLFTLGIVYESTTCGTLQLLRPLHMDAGSRSKVRSLRRNTQMIGTSCDNRKMIQHSHLLFNGLSLNGDT